MTKSQRARLGFGVWVLGFGISVLAHHSDAAFDPRQSVTLQGVVTRFVWENPHIQVQLTVTNADGTTARWAIEGNPPGRIGGKGLKDSLKVGDRVRISAYRAADPSHYSARGYELTLQDGRRFIIGEALSRLPPRT